MSIFSFIKKAVSSVLPADNPSEFSSLIEKASNELSVHPWLWNLKATESKVFNEEIMALEDKKKIALILDAVQQVHHLSKQIGGNTYNEHKYRLYCIWDTFMKHLFRTKLQVEDADIILILDAFRKFYHYSNYSEISRWPIPGLLTQVEKNFVERQPSPELIEALQVLKKALSEEQNYATFKDRTKFIERIEQIIFNTSNSGETIRPIWFPVEDEFGTYANSIINALKPEEKTVFFQLMHHCQKASGPTPTKKFLDEGKKLFTELGTEKFKKIANEWFDFIAAMKEKAVEQNSPYYGTYTTIEFFAPPNQDLLKGFIWLCVHFHDKATLASLAGVAERAYKKIPNKGPASVALGNAACYTLANSKGLDGVGYLSRLRLRITHSSIQNLIEKYLNKAAEKQGVSMHEIEDMAVDDYGLVDGSKTFEFDDYKAILTLTGTGKTELNWFKPDGSPQKSVPAFVKDKHAAKLKKLKAVIKQIELTSTAQRDRIDRMLKSERKLSWQQFQENYFTHGLMGFITKKLIWTFEENGNKDSVIFYEGSWTKPKDLLSFTPGENTIVSLWHPVFSNVDEIREWRNFLMDKKVVQPVKQAYREIYLLTDTEVNTSTYSNRMAAHILKQHQFNSLAKTRGWKYILIGGFDGANPGYASLNLNEYGLQAQFWINEVNADDAMSESGIFLYIATDQVRFIRLATKEVVELLEIPALVLSEVLRDVDLFVGVASVGNDPAWRDSGGLPAYRDYWQNFSFGELNAVAKTRKDILEKIVPRLKIAKVTEIKDRYLIVHGKLRTYKIHLGSTNIMMEPNDQYLCIVPARGEDAKTENIFLPFEGDNGVSIILSKAMLLADDDKIKDPTITSQIRKN